MTPAVITVFGGTGFIGQPLVRRLIAEGHEVRTVSRRKVPPVEHPRVTHIVGSVSDPATIARAVPGATHVVHMATGGGDSWRDYERDFIESTRAIATACIDAGVQRFLYASSIAALYLGGAGAVTEEQGTDPLPLKRGAYSRAKIAAEAVIAELKASRGLKAVIVRPGVVVGRGGIVTHSGLGLWQSATTCIGWGMGTTPLPFVLVDDVVDAMYAACMTPGIEGRAFNLAGDVRLTAAQFVSEIGRCSRRRIDFLPRPLPYLQAIEIGKWVLKIAARKKENTFPSYRHLKSAAMGASIDCRAAKDTLAWKPVADKAHFIREAIESNLTPIPDGDLRVPDLARV